MRATNGDYVSKMLHAVLFSVAETEVLLSAKDLSTIASYPPVIASMTRMPGLQCWWSIVEPTFGDEFRGYVRETVEAQAMQSVPAPHEFMPCLSPNASAGA